MKNNILKNFFSEEYDQNNNYERIMKHLEKRQLCRKKMKIVLCTILGIVVLSIPLVYAKEIKKIVNKVIYKYQTKEEIGDMSDFGFSNSAAGIHTISVNGYVQIKETTEKFNIYSLEELEEFLDFKILRPNINFKYFYYFTFNPNYVYKINGGIEKPTRIEINLSNYDLSYCGGENLQDSKMEQCVEETKKLQLKKKLSMKVIFLTQYANEEQIKDFNIYLADFANRKIEIYESDVINSKIYISFNSYIVVRDNIVYILENRYHQFSKEEMINIIENMHY